MDDRTRIEKDIIMFQENITKLDKIKLNENQDSIAQLAKQYYEDSIYYFEKEDYFTAFGCINYAHGLLDAIIKF
jgi:hypothetical protein